MPQLLGTATQYDCIRVPENPNQTQGSASRGEVVRNKHIAIFVIALVAVAVLAWYQSLPRPHGPTSPTAHWTEYVLTKNGNHTQVQASYSDGQENTEQILWLNFEIGPRSTTISVAPPRCLAAHSTAAPSRSSTILPRNTG